MTLNLTSNIFSEEINFSCIYSHLLTTIVWLVFSIDHCPSKGILNLLIVRLLMVILLIDCYANKDICKLVNCPIVGGNSFN